jgi:DDE family transposase
VDAEHALIVAHAITQDAGDNRQLEAMAEAAKKALDRDRFNIVADAGYSNGEQASRCEQMGLTPHVPATRAVNNQGDGTLFDRSAFHYQPETDTFLCPAGKTLQRKQLYRRDRAVFYQAQTSDCAVCSLQSCCTQAAQRIVSRHLDEEVLDRMHQRATPAIMWLRRSTVEHPFAALKYHIFGHPRLLLRGLKGAKAEIALAVMAYNLKRMVNVLGGLSLTQKLNPA